jgi:hypothetical protein
MLRPYNNTFGYGTGNDMSIPLNLLSARKRRSGVVDSLRVVHDNRALELLPNSTRYSSVRLTQGSHFNVIYSQ